MKTYSKMLEATFPKKNRLDFSMTHFSTLTYTESSPPIEVVFIPLSQYLKAIEAVTFAENALIMLESDSESKG